MSLGERECSIQRRHQKLIEEAPSLQGHAQDPRRHRQDPQDDASAAIGYQNAGTVEFLMDEDGKLYFIEMNTRIQVEHPVTEMVTGIDLVKAQLAHRRRREAVQHSSGDGRPSAATPSSAASTPSIRKSSRLPPGRITAFNLPGGNGVRVDTAQYAEGVVPPYYDSLIAKLIVHGKDRAEAMARMSRALEMFVVEGIHTTIPLHRRILRRPGIPRREFRYQVHGALLRTGEKSPRAAPCPGVVSPACTPFWMPACSSGPGFRSKASPVNCARPASAFCNTATKRQRTMWSCSEPRSCAPSSPTAVSSSMTGYRW